MANMKSTKRALIVSVMSLFICFTMLLGTTYAWFTDSVTSAGNIIKTGTLDVSLEYSKTAPADENDAAWTDASTGPIFYHDNWEPGYTQVRYVKVENEGSLDLKFVLTIVPTQKVADGEVDLADVIDVYIAKEVVAVDRAALTGLTRVGTLADLIADPDGAAYGVLYADDADKAGKTFEAYTIVLKMQETAGNEYQNLSLGGGFTVQLLATQFASESDDIGADYDTDATYPTVAKVKIPAGTTVPTPIKAGKTTVKIPAGVDAGEYEVSVSNENLETDENDNVTASFDIEVTKDGEKVGNGDYVVEKFIGMNLNLTEVTHKGEVVNGAVYDPATGIVTFTVNSFSPFAITYYSGVIENVEDLANIAKGGNFVLAADVELAGTTLVIPANKVVNLDLAGYEIKSAIHKSEGHVIKNEGTLVIGNGTVSSIADNGGSAIYNAAGGAITINGLTLNGAPKVADSWPSYVINCYGDMTINGADISCNHGAIAVDGGVKVVINDAHVELDGIGGSSHVFYIGGEGTEVIINDGVYNHNGNADGSLAYIMTGTSVTVNGGSFSAVNGGYGMATYTGSLTITGGTFAALPINWGGPITITGGSFTKNPSSLLGEGYKATKAGDVYMVTPGTTDVVVDAGKLDEALNNGQDVIITEDITAPDSNSNGYGNTALNVTQGQVIDGQGNTLSAPGATSTWDSALNITSGTVKNLTIDSGFRGIFVNHNGDAGKVYLENVVVDGPVYTISCDQGTGKGLAAVNSVFNGWTSYAATIGEVEFTNCSFGLGKSGYNFSRPYAPTTYTNCEFGADHYIDARAAVTLINCTYDGVLITEENVAELGLIDKNYTIVND